jgi:hypothetical protein
MKKALFLFVYSVWMLLVAFGVYVQWCDVGYGEEKKQTTGIITQEIDGVKVQYPQNYKIVPNDYDCIKRDPCAAYKKQIEDLKKQLAEARNKTCPKAETKIEWRDRYKYIDHIKEVEKKVPYQVPAPYMKRNVFRLLGAIGQDGVSTSGEAEDSVSTYTKDAQTYYSGLGGAGYTRFIDDSIGVGIFGLFGGNTSKMVGLSGEFAW